MFMSKGVNLTALLGGHKRRLGVWEWKSPSRVQWRSPGMGFEGQILREAEPFFRETTHDICIKIQQTTVVAVTG